MIDGKKESDLLEEEENLLKVRGNREKQRQEVGLPRYPWGVQKKVTWVVRESSRGVGGGKSSAGGHANLNWQGRDSMRGTRACRFGIMKMGGGTSIIKGKEVRVKQRFKTCETSRKRGGKEVEL